MTIKKNFLLFLFVALSLFRLKQKSSQSFTNNLESVIQKGKQFGINLLNKGKESLTKSYQWLWKTNEEKNFLDPLQNNSEKKLSVDNFSNDKKNILDKNIINEQKQNHPPLIEKNTSEKLEQKKINQELPETQKQKIKIKNFFKNIIENTENKKILKELKENPDKDKIESFLNSIFENNLNFNFQERKKIEMFLKKKINSKNSNIKNKMDNMDHQKEKNYSKEKSMIQEKIIQKELTIAEIEKKRKKEEEIENKSIEKKIINHILIPNKKKIAKEKKNDQKIKKIYEKIKMLNFISKLLNNKNNKNQYINGRKDEKNL